MRPVNKLIFQYYCYRIYSFESRGSMLYRFVVVILFLTHFLFYAAYSIDNRKSFLLAGTGQGIYQWDFRGDPVLVWNNEGFPPEIKKILPVPYGFFVLTSAGVFFSEDGRNFLGRNEGITYKTIKVINDGEKSFTNITEDLKDIEADPSNPDNLVTSSKDRVFISTNEGVSWFSIQGPVPYSTIKTLSIISSPDITIFLGHSFQGFFSFTLGKDASWKKMNTGLYNFSKTFEEISGIAAEKDNSNLNIYAVNNFTPILYQWSSRSNSWSVIDHFQKDFDMMESMVKKGRYIYFVNRMGIMRYNLDTKALELDGANEIKNTLELKTEQSVSAIGGYDENGEEFHFSELWLPSLPPMKNYYSQSSQKRGLYVQATALKDKKRLDKLIDFMKQNSLNMITVDMKDDSGYLRFKPVSNLTASIARVVNPIDLDAFIPVMKENNIYLTARLVVFKDNVLYSYSNYTYAVKSRSVPGHPWQGTKIGRDGALKNIREYWVDPYSEKVWEYNMAIARELTERGFDEIQFDYVRFPTDGLNLDDANFSFREKGMDKESAILSFLSYARQNLNVPISIDIYGANGYYRTDARTGQDVETLRKYVDVICPMFYPSHFSEDFQYCEPIENRPYRIYYFGTLRNYFIGKKELVIRPYVQAFKLFGQFDRKYYGPRYIADEISGVQNSIDLGYTFWNMGMKYSMLPDAYSNITIK